MSTPTPLPPTARQPESPPRAGQTRATANPPGPVKSDLDASLDGLPGPAAVISSTHDVAACETVLSVRGRDQRSPSPSHAPTASDDNCPIRRALDQLSSAAGAAARGAWRDLVPPADRLEPTAPTRELICQELWGGNQHVHQVVRMPGLEGVVFSRPCGGDAGGGDVHYFTACNAGEICRVCLADVAGHGQAAAQVSAWMHGLLRRNMSRFDPSLVFEALNRRMLETRWGRSRADEDAPADAAEGPTAETDEAPPRNRLPELLFATAVSVSYYAARQALSYCSAGHVPVLIRRAGERQWQRLEPTNPAEDAQHRPVRRGHARGTADGQPALANLPLGVVDRVGYRAMKTPLAPGDRLLLFSDGLIEIPIDATGAWLGLRGLEQLLAGLPEDGPERVTPGGDGVEGFARQLLAGLYAVAFDHTLAHDDVTFIVLEATAPEPHSFPVRFVTRKVRKFGRLLREGRATEDSALPSATLPSSAPPAHSDPDPAATATATAVATDQRRAE